MDAEGLVEVWEVEADPGGVAICVGDRPWAPIAAKRFASAWSELVFGAGVVAGFPEADACDEAGACDFFPS